MWASDDEEYGWVGDEAQLGERLDLTWRFLGRRAWERGAVTS